MSKKIILKAQDEEGNPINLTLSIQKGKEVAVTAPKKEKDKVWTITGRLCPKCGDKTWDNREKIKTGMFGEKSPHFACINKDDCKWAAWAGQYKIEADEMADIAEEVFND